MSSFLEQYAQFQMDGYDPELDKASVPLDPPDGEEPDRAAEYERTRREKEQAMNDEVLEPEEEQALADGYAAWNEPLTTARLEELERIASAPPEGSRAPDDVVGFYVDPQTVLQLVRAARGVVEPARDASGSIDYLEHLRTLATAATPGPWQARPNELIGGTAVYPHDSDREVADFTSDADARYIAAVHPLTVLRLIHELQELRAAGPEPGFGR